MTSLPRMARTEGPGERLTTRRSMCHASSSITGGSGFIGSAVVPELHRWPADEVVGPRPLRCLRPLHWPAPGPRSSRGTSRTSTPSAAGPAPPTESYVDYVHDFSDMAIGAAVDLRAIEAIGATLAGSGKPFVITTGTLLLALGDVGLASGVFGTEKDVSLPPCQGRARRTPPSRWPSGGAVLGDPPVSFRARGGRPWLRPDPHRHRP